MDKLYNWEEYLPLVKFYYSNGYHASLKVVPFEALCGKRSIDL